jgi:hypothetical protein
MLRDNRLSPADLPSALAVIWLNAVSAGETAEMIPPWAARALHATSRLGHAGQECEKLAAMLRELLPVQIEAIAQQAARSKAEETAWTAQWFQELETARREKRAPVMNWPKPEGA